MRKILSSNFFLRPAPKVAKDLLGKYLVRKVNGKTTAYKIVETEAYLGQQDKASHARSGMTKRNEPMFGPPGHWYVYFTYGMHHMLNIVTGPAGQPSAVLIRGLATIQKHIPLIRTNKGYKKKQLVKLDGPGKLTKALKIDKKLNGKYAARVSGLWIEEDREVYISSRKIKHTPRIGIAYAEEWVEKPLRFVLEK